MSLMSTAKRLQIEHVVVWAGVQVPAVLLVAAETQTSASDAATALLQKI